MQNQKLNRRSKPRLVHVRILWQARCECCGKFVAQKEKNIDMIIPDAKTEVKNYFIAVN